MEPAVLQGTLSPQGHRSAAAPGVALRAGRLALQISWDKPEIRAFHVKSPNFKTLATKPSGRDSLPLSTV